MLSASERATLIEQHRIGLERLQRALDRVAKAGRHWRAAPGEWSSHEVIIHCADS